MPVLIFSSNVLASRNIADALIELGFEKNHDDTWRYKKTEMIDCKATSILDVPTNFSTDYLVILSPHKSMQAKATLTAHFPGNWDKADFGGEPRTLNIACASRIKTIIREIARIVKKRDLTFEASLEVDHHGPTCDLPIVYAELGNNEKQWTDKRGAAVIAEAIFNSLDNNERYETVFGVGDGHYPKKFNEIMLNSDIAVGHMLPKYLIETLGEDTFRQAIEKNVEKVEKVIVSKDGTNIEQKERIRKLANDFGIEYKEE